MWRAHRMQLQNVNLVLRNMNRKAVGIRAAVERGVIKAAMLLQAEAQARVPVEFGELQASAYTIPLSRGRLAIAEVGFTAPYAAHVHESVEMKLLGQDRWQQGGKPPPIGKFWDPRPQGQPKFLEEPATQFQPVFQAILVAEVAKATQTP